VTSPIEGSNPSLPASEKAPQDGVLFSFGSQGRNASADMQAEAVQGALRYCLFKTPDEFSSPSLQKATSPSRSYRYFRCALLFKDQRYHHKKTTTDLNWDGVKGPRRKCWVSLIDVYRHVKPCSIASDGLFLV